MSEPWPRAWEIFLDVNMALPRQGPATRACAERAVADRGLGDRIRPVVADMADPGVPPESFDLVWSEGALHNVGIEKAVGVCRLPLRPGRLREPTPMGQPTQSRAARNGVLLRGDPTGERAPKALESVSCARCKRLKRSQIIHLCEILAAEQCHRRRPVEQAGDLHAHVLGHQAFLGPRRFGRTSRRVAGGLSGLHCLFQSGRLGRRAVAHCRKRRATRRDSRRVQTVRRRLACTKLRIARRAGSLTSGTIARRARGGYGFGVVSGMPGCAHFRKVAHPTLLLLSVLAARRPAQACCGPARIIDADVTPGATDVAPLNTHVRVTFSAFEDHTVVWTRSFDEDSPRVPVDEIVLSLRLAAPRAVGVGAPVEVRTIRVGSGWDRVIDLAPRASLLPGTTYEVVASHHQSSMVIHRFNTGDCADTKPPSLSGVTGTFAPKPPAKPTRKGVIMLHDTSWSYEPYTWLEIGSATDDQAHGNSLRFAVWMPNDRGQFDLASAPITYVIGISMLPSRYQVALGPRSICDNNLDVPPKGGTIRLVLRAVDLAGNMSEPVEVSTAVFVHE
jgi:hypothetical protein